MSPDKGQDPASLFDLKELKATADGNDEFFAEMVQLFISETRSAIGEIKDRLASGDYVKVRGILHKMKPSIMVMGVHEVGKLIALIEQMDMQHVDGTLFSDRCSKIEEILNAVNRELSGD